MNDAAPPSRRLCLFARAPVPGQVKQRLAAQVGDEKALEIHCELVEGTLARCAVGTAYQTELWVAGEIPPESPVYRWLRDYPVELKQQVGEDLGERMLNALSRSLSRGVVPVLIGSDCPGIDADYVLSGFEALKSVDVVLGPAADGGYGLIGCRTDVPELFDMPWGTDQVADRTVALAESLGLTITLLEEIHDVDTLTDWQRYLGEC